jgi:hypothetical protein
VLSLLSVPVICPVMSWCRHWQPRQEMFCEWSVSDTATVACYFLWWWIVVIIVVGVFCSFFVNCCKSCHVRLYHSKLSFVSLVVNINTYLTLPSAFVASLCPSIPSVCYPTTSPVSSLVIRSNPCTCLMPSPISHPVLLSLSCIICRARVTFTILSDTVLCLSSHSIRILILHYLLQQCVLLVCMYWYSCSWCPRCRHWRCT